MLGAKELTHSLKAKDDFVRHVLSKKSCIKHTSHSVERGAILSPGKGLPIPDSSQFYFQNSIKSKKCLMKKFLVLQIDYLGDEFLCWRCFCIWDVKNFVITLLCYVSVVQPGNAEPLEKRRPRLQQRNGCGCLVWNRYQLSCSHFNLSGHFNKWVQPLSKNWVISGSGRFTLQFFLKTVLGWFLLLCGCNLCGAPHEAAANVESTSMCVQLSLWINVFKFSSFIR